jgi:hypothetical protein
VHNVPKRLLAIALWIAALGLGFSRLHLAKGQTPTPGPLPRPKLVIIITIDQFRNDYLDRFHGRFVEGGFNRLLGGARFVNCRFDDAITVTAAGHATLATGAYPNVHGIIENEWYDRSLKRPVSSVEDPNTRLVGSGQGPSEQRGASPHYLAGSTLGDELRLASGFLSKVVSIALKDRGAVHPGGHTANAAYWYQPQTGRFVSSTYYMTALPRWASDFNDSVPTREFCGKAWTALPETPDGGGTTFGEYKPAEAEACPGPEFHRWLMSTPFITGVELKFAREAVRNEKLGQGPGTDLLTIAFCANDFIGHAFGPYSPQVADTVHRTDRYLADFLTDVDQMLGLSNVWIVLTADHGVAPPPSLVNEHRLGVGMLRTETLRDAVEVGLTRAFGPDRWTENVNLPYIYLSQGAVREHKLQPSEVETEAANLALAVPGVHAVFTRSDILAGRLPRSLLARKVTNSFYPKRSGDVFVVLEPFAVPSFSETSTTHGTPWSYDAQIPLVFWGRAFQPGTYAAPCQPIDLASTLAVALGLDQPSGAAGVPLSVALAKQ